MILREVLQTYGLRAYGRKSWNGRAVVRTGNGNTVLEVGPLRLPYTHPVEDVLGDTDDWEILERYY